MKDLGVDGQSRFLQSEEITSLGEAMAEDAAIADVAHAAIRFLLLSGFRRMEALALPRAWLDARARCVRFADELLLHNTTLAAIAPHGSAEDFGEPLHAKIFTVVAALIAVGKVASPITLKPYLGDAELAEGVAMGAYLARLAGAALPPSERWAQCGSSAASPRDAA